MGKNKKIRLLELLLVLLSLSIWSNAQSSDKVKTNRLCGLREGRIYILTDNFSEKVKLNYIPIYGWNEPILILKPDGRIMSIDRYGHKNSGSKEYELNKGKGIYTIVLKPSYVYCVETTADKMVFEPEQESMAFYRRFSDHPFVFKAPEGCRRFSVLFSNIDRFKAKTAQLELINPKGKITGKLKKKGWSKKEILKHYTDISIKDLKTGQKGSDLNITEMPDFLKPDIINITDPEPGFWQARTGATGINPYKSNFRISGADNYIAAEKKYWFKPVFHLEPVDVHLKIDTFPMSCRTFTGFVGNMGRPGSLTETLLKETGQMGDKHFLWQDKMMPARGKFKFLHKERFSPDHNVFSLIVFRKEAERLQKLNSSNRISSWKIWTKKTADYLLNKAKRSPSGFALQILNEPNLETEMDSYLAGFKKIGGALKKDPVFSEILLAGPGLGSGEENDLIDWKWIQALISQADPVLDIITWNTYKIKNIEDTFLFREAVEKTCKIIRQKDRDGQFEDIIIGAANRTGGIAPDSLFNSWDAAIWWASTLTNVINTGKVKGIYYYNVIDKGHGRKKGMFDSNLKRKSQAYVNMNFADLLKSEDLYRVTSDHFLVEAVAAKDGSIYKMILINKGRLSAFLHSEFFKNSKIECKKLEPDGSLTEKKIKEDIIIGPREILILTIS